MYPQSHLEMFKCDQCSYLSSRKYDLKRHERLKHHPEQCGRGIKRKHYPEQCGTGIKRKHYPIQYGKGVEKDTEEDTDIVISDDTYMEDLKRLQKLQGMIKSLLKKIPTEILKMLLLIYTSI